MSAPKTASLSTTISVLNSCATLGPRTADREGAWRPVERAIVVLRHHEAALREVRRIVRTDPDRAERLLDEVLTDAIDSLMSEKDAPS